MFPGQNRPTRTVVIWFTVIGVALVAVQAILGPGSIVRNFRDELLAVAAGAVATLGGFGLVTDQVRRRRWERSTAFIVVNALDQAMYKIAMTVSLGLPTTDTEMVRTTTSTLAAAYRLPVTEQRVEEFAVLRKAIVDYTLKLFEDDAAAEALAARIPSVAGEMEAHATGLWSLCVEIHDAIGLRRSEDLLGPAMAFVGQARDLADQLQLSLADPATVARMRGLLAATLTDVSTPLAWAINAIFLSLLERDDLPVPVRNDIVSRVDAARIGDVELAEGRAQDRLMEALLVSLDRMAAPFTAEAGEKLAKDINDLTPEERAEVEPDRQALIDALDKLLTTLNDGAVEE